MAYRIFIDPGHGGKDPGAIGPTGLKEKDVNLDIAKRLGELLKVNGIMVNYTRTTDIFVDLGERAAIANRWGANYFVSVHCNAFTDRQANGVETYCYDFGGEGEKLARKVQATVVKATGLKNRADVKKAGFTVLEETAMSAILVETAFISNPVEEKKLATPAFRQTVAVAIAKGICEYLGIGFIEAKPPAKDDNAPDGKLYKVQVGAFKNKANAEALLQKLKKAGFDGFIKLE
jgi:N-acetylmuramoyl-L-alanine amidase